ncbi:MAG: non-histone chromosomal protein MC1 [halophilic archaeon J07HX5]|nr:MAG: non-histone chromosomal protein MC1 [halophilic archaeon J07HX5]
MDGVHISIGVVIPMADDKRNFALRDGSEETSVFSGGTPRQAALKAARRLDPATSESRGQSNATELRLREKGTHKVHVYLGWAWEESAPDDKPDWMPDEITKGNVSKEGVEHLEEI